jgi:hypothetical protein
VETINKANFRLYFGLILFAVIAFILLNTSIFNDLNKGIKFISLASLLIISWLLYLKYAIPRCSKCGYSVFSVLEVKGFPIITKMKLNDGKCSWCGEKLD